MTTRECQNLQASLSRGEGDAFTQAVLGNSSRGKARRVKKEKRARSAERDSERKKANKSDKMKKETKDVGEYCSKFFCMSSINGLLFP